MNTLNHPLHIDPEHKVVCLVGQRGRGWANSIYEVFKADASSTDLPLARLQFQDGAPDDQQTIQGLHNEDLIMILMDRIRGLDGGYDVGYHDPNNHKAVEHLEYALMHLCKRTQDRRQRGIEGTQQK